MILLLIISILLVVSVTGIALWRIKALPESISSLVYVFRWKWLWTVWLTIVGILTCAPAIEVLDRIGMGFLGFSTLACLIFCAAMPIFMKEQRQWHNILGISACILSQICVFFISMDWLYAWVLFIFLMVSVYVQPQGGITKVVKGKGVFVAECICYIALEGSLIFKICLLF